MEKQVETQVLQSTEVVVEARNLSKTYRDFWGRSKKVALKPLDLEIRQGEIFGLLGPNGSGKTTTMKLLLGLIFPTSGEAVVFGKDATDVSKNDRIGYLPEESYLYKFLDAEETLDFYGRLFDMPPDERKRRADALIEMVGLGRDKKRQLREYSKGMTRRIGVAQALINDPELVLLDEPTNHLDMDMRQALTIALQEFGGAILLISHDRHLLVNTVDEFLIIDNGKLTNFNGDLEDYRKAILKGTTNFKQKEENDRNPIVKIDKKQARQIRAQISTNEKTLKRLQRKLSETEAFLNSPESYTDESGPDLQSLLRNQADLTSQIELTEEEWLQLNTQLEN